MNKKAKIITALGLMGVLFMGTGMQQVDAKDKAPAQTEQQAGQVTQTQESAVIISKMRAVFFIRIFYHITGLQATAQA